MTTIKSSNIMVSQQTFRNENVCVTIEEGKKFQKKKKKKKKKKNAASYKDERLCYRLNSIQIVQFFQIFILYKSFYIFLVFLLIFSKFNPSSKLSRIFFFCTL